MRLLATCALATVPAALMAHSGHGAADMATAAAHPWMGLDHLLAMVTVGALGWRLGGKAQWMLPAAFIGGMSFGAVTAVAGLPGYGLEWLLSGSVVVLGVLLAVPRLPAAAWLYAAVALLAVAHGHAHTTELGATVSPGFLFSTALLHACGCATAWALSRVTPAQTVRWAGAGVAAAGLMVMMSVA